MIARQHRPAPHAFVVSRVRSHEDSRRQERASDRRVNALAGAAGRTTDAPATRESASFRFSSGNWGARSRSGTINTGTVRRLTLGFGLAMTTLGLTSVDAKPN